MYKKVFFKLNESNIMRFFRLSTYEKYLIAETVFFLLLFRFIIVVFPARYYSRILLGRNTTDSDEADLPGRDRFFDSLSRILYACNNHMPWGNKCLAAAITAKTMLRIRGYKSTLYLGLKKDGSFSLHSHSWLKCGEKSITGGIGEGLVLVSKFT